MRISLIAALVLIVASPSEAGLFKGVRQSDLDAWVGIPVEALDTHSIFITMKLVRTVTDSGIEIRNYVNSEDVSRCFGNGFISGQGGFVSGSQFTRCSANKITCNNIFYIKDRKVLEYAPTGRCFTDKRARPEARYSKLLNP